MPVPVLALQEPPGLREPPLGLSVPHRPLARRLALLASIPDHLEAVLGQVRAVVRSVPQA